MASTPQDPGRWRRISEIVANALELPKPERAAMLDAACLGDPELRAEIEALLGVDSVAADAIGGVVNRTIAGVEQVESRIGPYEIVREIGRGGMGAVYLARRSDGEFTHMVAIKLVKRGLDSDFILARFRHERQILARLAHPNIARLLDGGSTPSGQPYFVMEHIDGRPIAEYCRELDATEILQLFLPVCDALAYAHRSLVIHRDLKPGNILVTADGVPKLLDFGIAKLTDPSYSETAPETSTGLRLLTPDYASPEQVRGEPVDTRSDVYSLGAVLYELLTGARPHDLERYTPGELERVVCESEVTPPSAAAKRLGDRRRARRLAGDLDNIILMALRKEPAQRYGSVEQVAADLRRHLAGEPVDARRPTYWYRAAKFVRRNRIAVVAATLVIVSTAAGLATSLYQARRAERRFAQVRKLANTFLFDFHDSIENLPGSMKSRELVVRTASEYLDSLAREATGDRALQSELAMAYLKVGDLQGDPRRPNLGQTAAAYQSYRKAMDLAEAALLRDPGNLTLTRAAVQIANKLSDVSYRLDGSGPAIASCRRGLAASDRIIHSSGIATDLDWEARRSLLNILGDMLAESGDLEQAIEVYRAALETVDHNTPGARTEGARVVCLTRMGTAMGKSGRLADGVQYLEQARARQESLAAADPTNVRHKRVLTAIYQRLGDLLGRPDLVNLGETQRAIDLYRRAIPIGEAMLQAEPKNSQALNGLSFSYEGLGALLLESDPERSAEAFAKTLRMRRQLLEGAPRDLDYKQTYGAAATGLAAAKFRLNHLVDAETLYREGLKSIEEVCRLDPSRRIFQIDRLMAQLGLARLLASRHSWEEALELLQVAVREADRMNQPRPGPPLERRGVPLAYAGLADFYERQAAQSGLAAAARREFLDRALSARRKEQSLWNDWLKENIAVAFAKPKLEASMKAAAELVGRQATGRP